MPAAAESQVFGRCVAAETHLPCILPENGSPSDATAVEVMTAVATRGSFVRCLANRFPVTATSAISKAHTALADDLRASLDPTAFSFFDRAGRRVGAHC